MTNSITKEYGGRIEKLHNKTIELRKKLNDIPDSEKYEIYFELKNSYHELKKIYQWMTDIDPLITQHYPLAFERAYCNEIYFYRKYLNTYKAELDFNEFLNLAFLIYDFFYTKEFKVSIDLKRNLANLVYIFDGEMTMIIDGLEKAIELIHDDNIFKKDKFEYHNTLGDLHFQIFLLVKEYANHEEEFMNDHLDKAINNYLYAKQSSKKKNTYKDVKHLPIFILYMRDHGISHFLDIKNKLKVLSKEFPENMVK